MLFEATPIPGSWSITLECRRDPRGTFVRTFDEQSFRLRGLADHFAQHSEAWNEFAGTLRGLHYQAAPSEETKLIRVASGAVFDVLLDLRNGPTFGRWWSTILRASEPRAIYCPAGVAHGYQTLEPGTVISYLISPEYAPDAARGVHYASPSLAIPWPLTVRALSDRDAAFPTFGESLRS